MKRVLCGAVLMLVAWSVAASAAEPPSRLKVLGLSLLLPGLGHAALGHTTRGEAFMAADLGLWTTFGAFRVQGHLRSNSYVDMAGIFAGVQDPEGHPDEYYRQLGQYASSDEYNEEVRREARAQTGDDLAGRAAYYERHKVPADQEWRWTSAADWQRYQDKRSESQLSYKRASYMIGLAVANRLIAAVDAMRLAHGHRSGQGEGISFYLSGDPSEPREPVRLCVGLRLP